MENTRIRFIERVWAERGYEWMCDGIANNHPETGWGATKEQAIADFEKQVAKYQAMAERYF